MSIADQTKEINAQIAQHYAAIKSLQVERERLTSNLTQDRKAKIESVIESEIQKHGYALEQTVIKSVINLFDVSVERAQGHIRRLIVNICSESKYKRLRATMEIRGKLNMSKQVLGFPYIIIRNN